MRKYLLLVMLFWMPAFGQEATEIPTRYQNAIAELEALIQTDISENQLVGVTVAFSQGDVHWSKGYGFSDLENKTAASEKSSYRMASVSKPMTAVGILELVEQGKVDLDAEVQTYLPNFPRKQWPLTVRQLLGHLGGVSHYRNYSAEALTVNDMTTEEALQIFQDWELLAEPGTEYNYTTYGYNVLWAIIESAAGMSFQDFMTSKVWQPLEMNNTSVDYLYQLIPDRVQGYRIRNGHVENSVPVSTSLKIGGGGTRATATDMVHFAKGLSAGKVLDKATRNEMWTSMSTKAGRTTYYAMGWSVDGLSGRYLVAHGGAQEGTRTDLAHFPGIDLTIAVASNLENSSPRKYSRFLAYEMLGLNRNLPNPYFSNEGDKQLHSALRKCLNQGVAYYDWQKKASNSNDAHVAEAFALLNNDNLTSELVNAGSNAIGKRAWQTAGSYMAMQIARLAPKQLPLIYNQAPLEMAVAYHTAVAGRADVPTSHQFTPSVAAKLKTWNANWKSLQNDGGLEIKANSDVKMLESQFKKKYGNSALVPDYSERIWQMVQEAFAVNPKQAYALAKLGVEQYPNSATALGAYGIVDVVMGSRESGAKSLRKSIKLDSRGPANQNNLNNLAYRVGGLGQPAAAVKLLSVAVELNPDVANLRDSLGEFYLATGDKEKAIASYKKAIELDPDFQNPKDMLKQIAEMK